MRSRRKSLKTRVLRSYTSSCTTSQSLTAFDAPCVFIGKAWTLSAFALRIATTARSIESYVEYKHKVLQSYAQEHSAVEHDMGIGSNVEAKLLAFSLTHTTQQRQQQQTKTTSEIPDNVGNAEEDYIPSPSCPMPSRKKLRWNPKKCLRVAGTLLCGGIQASQMLHVSRVVHLPRISISLQ